MPTNEEGEFELILGNKQLLSVFFIVVVLLGVFFAMGYIVGRNSAPGKTEVASTTRPSERPTTPMETPVQPSSAPSAVNPPADQPVEKPAAVKKQAPPPEEKAPAPAPAATDTPPTGSYWQVAATKRAEAELLVDLLKGKGYKARMIPAPGTEGYFRVLIGPAVNTAALSVLKADLEALGYKNPIKRDY
ncbi:MAG: SPOR domain-containing protein [Bryobacteraceae bacterium]